MVNKALLTASLKLSEQQQKEKETRAKNQVRRLPKGFPQILRMVSGEPVFVSMLVDPKLNMPLHIHIDFVQGANGKGGYYKYSICHQTYQQFDPTYVDCPICQELNEWGNPKRATEIKAIPVYNHSNEGKTWKDKDGNENPVEVENILIYRPGESKANFIAYDNFNLKNALAPGKFVFEVKKIGEKKDTRYLPLAFTPAELLGDEFDPKSEQVKAVMAKWAKFSDDEVYQRILAMFAPASVDWELWGIDEPKAEEVKSDSKADTSKGKSKDGLN